MRTFSLIATVVLLCGACATTTMPAAAPASEVAPSVAPEMVTTPAGSAPTVEEATKFVEGAEARLAALNVDAQRAAWVQATYITHDTQIIAARENEKLINAGVEL